MNWRSCFTVAVLSCTLLAASAEARLGEKVSLVERRFGAPIRKAPYRLDREKIDRRIYFEPGWVILVTYWEGRSAHEQYFRIADSLPRDWVRDWFSVPGSFWERDTSTVFLRNLGRHSEGLSNKEIRTILQASAEGQRWFQAAHRSLFFTRGDREALGRYVRRGDDGESFLVVTADFEQRLVDALGDGDPEVRAKTGRITKF